VGKLKGILLLLLGALVLPCQAHPVIDTGLVPYYNPDGPAPWPWPWKCPIRWNTLVGSWELPNDPAGSMLSISMVNTPQGNLAVNVQRTDTNLGPHSGGEVMVPSDSAEAYVLMHPKRNGVTPYLIRFSMTMYKTKPVESCQDENVVPLITLNPNDPPDEQSNYVLESDPYQ
jgi:hypothetical protein